MVALLGKGVELLLRDLADVAQDVCGELSVWVVTEILVRDLDAREIVPALLQVTDLELSRTVLDRHRREQVVAVAPQRAADVDRRHQQDARELAQLAQAGASILRQVGLPDLHGGARNVRHEWEAVAIDDRAPRRLDAYVPALVVLRRPQQLLAVEDLQGPEPQEERREDRDRHHPEQPDP